MTAEYHVFTPGRARGSSCTATHCMAGLIAARDPFMRTRHFRCSTIHTPAAVPSGGLVRRTLLRMFHDHEKMPTADQALPGRDEPVLKGRPAHLLFGENSRYVPPFPEGLKVACFGNGCFWGPEMRFWEMPGVYSTAVGFCGGLTPNPTYEEVCTGLTGHNEVTRVIYNPALVSFADMLKLHWESHDPTQGMGQGNDRGTQYRSGIYCSNDVELKIARASLDAYQNALNDAGHRNGARITTEIVEAPPFYYAEEYHQQYLARPGARQYCSAQPTLIDLPDAAEWMPSNVSEDMYPKISPQWWKENPPGCHLFTAAYAQRYRLRRLHAEEEEESRKKLTCKL